MSPNTNGFDFDAVDSEQVAEVAAPLVADAHISHPNRFKRRSRQMFDRLGFQGRLLQAMGSALGHARQGHTQSRGACPFEKIPAV